MKNNNSKIILDLCGGTGSWSLPYKEAGYDVLNVTLPKWDILNTDFGEFLIRFRSPDMKYETLVKSNDIVGILAAPPCTHFSFARTNAKKPRDLAGAMEIVNMCLKIIEFCQLQIKTDTQKYSPLKFWALENPYHAMTRWFLGNPVYTFNPWEFGHNYQKKTALWGYFNPPVKKYTKREQVMTKKQMEQAKTNSQPMPKFDYMKSRDIAPDWFGKLDRKARRAITPRGFAEAFYKANK